MQSKRMIAIAGQLSPKSRKKGFFSNISRYKFLYVLILPGLLYFIIFHYIPMYGVVIAFQDFKPFGGLEAMVLNPEWVGVKHFQEFFGSYYFGRLLENTLLISFYKLLFGFPLPIILALMLNEVVRARFKKIVQTISYLPHFLSWVIISGMVIALLSPTAGPINMIITALGGKPTAFMGEPGYFRSVVVASDVWASVGWGSIVYLAALAGINPALYESARIDGANRFRQMLHISLPGISNIISILFVLSAGNILNAGFEQVLLLYSPSVYSSGDIIDTYVYREGLLKNNFSYAAAIGMFKNVIGLLFLIVSNYVVKRMGREGVW
ncbi:ABC transporter permease [Paenibacillus eucommiae]|uniref:Aldouronate transport system permease protein n=1 Tax=Paenibacillus eucommiae TaxID=1355755 RepID=A0ABS4JCP4_9BACL|nr:ABC transporter permease subunit [Paenibacillus eucommiae]MBP1997006.1 putative aldouronate transport system permease protein [Paenibacillus eucommiae]